MWLCCRLRIKCSINNANRKILRKQSWIMAKKIHLSKETVEEMMKQPHSDYESFIWNSKTNILWAGQIFNLKQFLPCWESSHPWTHCCITLLQPSYTSIFEDVLRCWHTASTKNILNARPKFYHLSYRYNSCTGCYRYFLFSIFTVVWLCT